MDSIVGLIAACGLGLVAGMWLGSLRARESTAVLRATVDLERARRAEQQHLAEQSRAELKHAFASLSAQALEQNNRQFLDLATAVMDRHTDHAKTDLQGRHTAIEQLVQPLRDVLGQVQQQFGEIEKTRAGSEGKLLSQLAHLERSTGSLAQALRAPQARGRWGEMHLRRVVEVAGMLHNCDFVEQETFTVGAEQRLRPDMIVRMASSKSIAVDAKVPMDAYLRALDSEDATLREELLDEHAQRVRTHVQDISGKYWQQLDPGTVMVVMFLPTEDLYRVALEKDPTLLEYATQRNVTIATPSTLIVVLRAIAQGWREEALAENAAAISELGAQMYDRIVTVTEHVSHLGRSIRSSVKQYNAAVASIESRLLPSARNLRDLDVSTAREIPQCAVLEELPREPNPVQRVEDDGRSWPDRWPASARPSEN